MAVKTNDAQAQQALDRGQPTSKLALRLLTAAETRHVAAGITVIDMAVTPAKPMAE